MKKKILLLTTLLLLVNLQANAYQAKEGDYIIESEKVQNGATQDGSVDNDVIHASNITPLNEEKTEYKFRYGTDIGYYNKDLNIKFLTNFDNIYLLDKYIKIKKKGKYGVITKEGKPLIPAVCQKIDVLHGENDALYFLAKIEGKYQILSENGALVPESELTSIPNSSMYILADAIRPEFVKSYIDSQSVYTKLDTEEEAQKIASMEGSELKAEEQPSAKTNENYTVEEVEIPEMVKVASVEKNVKEKESSYDKQKSGESKFTVHNKVYTLVYQNNKFGIKDENGNLILPVDFDSISLKNPANSFLSPVLLVEKNNALTIYDLKGKLIAEQIYDKINVYDKKNIYSISFKDDSGILLKNGKPKGTITRSGKDYNYKPNGFELFTPHRINELIVTMLSAAK